MEGIALFLVGVLIMVIGLAVSIALHEIGHLVPAKLFGVRCPQYMVGFGRTLWSTRRGETEYGVKAVPLGGYVRMIGMFPPRPEDDGRVRSSSSNPLAQLVEEARDASWEEVGPEDTNRVFYRLPVWQRLVVMAGGPVMNLLICAVLLAVILPVHGQANVVPKLEAISQCVVAVDARDDTEPSCEGEPPSPALAAGFEPGDEILSVNGTPVNGDWAATSYAIQNSPARATFVVERDGATRTLEADLVRAEVALRNPDGSLQLDSAGEAVMGTASFLGAQPSIEYQPVPVTEVPAQVWTMATRTADVVLNLPSHLVRVADAAFGSAERDPEGPMSVVGVGRAAGEIAQHGILPGDTPVDKFWTLMTVLAALNMALFVFNLIPLLPLDGGHIAGALWEGLKRMVAKVFRRPEPAPVDTAKLLPVAYVVALALFAMSALLIYADIVKPISLT